MGSTRTAQVLSVISDSIELIEISHTLVQSQLVEQYFADLKPSENGPKPFL